MGELLTQMMVPNVDNLLFVSGSWNKRLYASLDPEDGTARFDLQLAKQAGTQVGFEFGSGGGGFESDREDAAGKTDQTSMILERNWH